MSEQPEFALVPQWDVADRMRKSLREASLGIQEMADYLGVGRNTVSTWVNGKINPSTQTLRLWAMKTGVSYPWLAAGEEETHVAAGQLSKDPRVNNAHSSRRGQRASFVLLSKELGLLGPPMLAGAA